jgi:hypothetical protein
MNFDTEVNEHQEQLKEKIIKLQKESNLFLEKELKDIHLFFLYTINHKLETFKRIDLKLHKSILSKNDLLSEILKHKRDDGRKFNITGLYKYHFVEDLSQFVDTNVLSSSFSSLGSVDDVHYCNNMELFQDYSSLFIVLQNEKSVKTKKQIDTKKNKTIRKI